MKGQLSVQTRGCLTSEDLHVLLLLAVSRALPATRLRTGVTGSGRCAVGSPPAGSDPRSGVRSGQPQHQAKEYVRSHKSGDVVGLLYPAASECAKAWIEEKLTALRTDRVGGFEADAPALADNVEWPASAAWLRGKPSKPHRLQGALAYRVSSGVETSGRGLQTRYPSTFQVGGDALEAARFPQRAGVTAEPTQHDLRSVLGQLRPQGASNFVTYGMKADPLKFTTHPAEYIRYVCPER